VTASRPVPVLRLENIVKNFGGVQALKGVTLEVHQGEVLALVGENGAGKSTLVGVASGRLTPAGGSVLVDGRPRASSGPAAATSAGIRLVPQELLLCPDMTVLDNVLLGERPRRFGVFLSRPAARRQARERMSRLGVDGIDLGRETGTLPVVEQAFVQIAHSFTPGARVLLIDEPTAPMDDREVERFFAVLQALRREGVAIVYISHRLDEIFRLADRVAVMRDGLVVAELSGADMNRGRVVAEMVGHRELRDPIPNRAVAGDGAALECVGISGATVRDFSLRLAPGEIACVYGISGSGREELASLIVGARPRAGGEVRVAGRAIRRGSVSDAIAHGMGYVPAERRTQGLVLESSVGANLTLAILHQLAHRGFLAPRTPDRVASSWISRLDIRAPGPATPVGALSGGSQQKVMLARWLAADSTILVLEEPTRGVDVATKAEIYHLLHGLLEHGKSVLVISSDIEEATLVAERVLVMREGRLLREMVRPNQHQLALAAQGATEEHYAAV
jgi:rhamnose transport system ATP-binding protein